MARALASSASTDLLSYSAGIFPVAESHLPVLCFTWSRASFSASVPGSRISVVSVYPPARAPRDVERIARGPPACSAMALHSVCISDVLVVENGIMSPAWCLLDIPVAVSSKTRV